MDSVWSAKVLGAAIECVAAVWVIVTKISPAIVLNLAKLGVCVSRGKLLPHKAVLLPTESVKTALLVTISLLLATRLQPAWPVGQATLRWQVVPAAPFAVLGSTLQ